MTIQGTRVYEDANEGIRRLAPLRDKKRAKASIFLGKRECSSPYEGEQMLGLPQLSVF